MFYSGSHNPYQSCMSCIYKQNQCVSCNITFMCTRHKHWEKSEVHPAFSSLALNTHTLYMFICIDRKGKTDNVSMC